MLLFASLHSTRRERRAILALPLLVAGVFADHADDALPLDQLALIANPADARSHLHDPPARRVKYR
jgi:hypothetical protein